jgi:hypothetical protein
VIEAAKLRAMGRRAVKFTESHTIRARSGGKPPPIHIYGMSFRRGGNVTGFPKAPKGGLGVWKGYNRGERGKIKGARFRVSEQLLAEMGVQQNAQLAWSWTEVHVPGAAALLRPYLDGRGVGTLEPQSGEPFLGYKAVILDATIFGTPYCGESSGNGYPWMPTVLDGALAPPSASVEDLMPSWMPVWKEAHTDAGDMKRAGSSIFAVDIHDPKVEGSPPAFGPVSRSVGNDFHFPGFGVVFKGDVFMWVDTACVAHCGWPLTHVPEGTLRASGASFLKQSVATAIDCFREMSVA